ncbi:hypothetical protein D3C75_232450 [compost metagenome]
MGGDVGCVPVTQRSAGECFAAHFLHHQPARAVAAGAMRQAFHQIGAAIPLRTLARIGLERFLVQEQQVPHRHGLADAEGEWQFGRVRFLVDRRHLLHEVGIQRVDVLVGQLGIRGIGHRRIQMGAILAHAFAHCFGEVILAVEADAMAFGGGDVAGPDLTQRGRNRVAAGVRFALFRAGVTRHAVCGDREVAPTFGDLVCACGVTGCSQQHQQSRSDGLHAARSMASAARNASAAMVRVLLTTLADTIGPPPGSHRFG